MYIAYLHIPTDIIYNGIGAWQICWLQGEGYLMADQGVLLRHTSETECLGNDFRGILSDM